MPPPDEDPELASKQAPAPGPEELPERDEAQEDDERVDTPFDHPLFLPVVLAGLTLWFLWDGFIVPMEDHLLFNRGGFAVFLLATLWYGYKGLQEMREKRERDGGD